MENGYKEITIKDKTTILEALKLIDKNKKSFLIIVNNEKIVMGLITEGEIRRQIIKGDSLNAVISYNRNFKSINMNESFTNLFEYFKSEKINFIPVINDDQHLINIISKKQFHLMLLKDIDYDLKKLPYLNENELDYEIFPRPWGFYKSTLLAKHVQSKIITVFPQEELSLQKHKRREEHWIIIKGEGKIVLEETILNVEQGRYIYIPKGCKHKVINSSEKENLIFAEVQLGDYFGEDDIIRYEDKYGRV
ncbi:CBS domain-containing protein [Poseidonibacter lekithochrous]|uniref:CBS domain-containing protein n=1 Tax=Poseidonibacter TaxID=2321187 RepID=UPI001C0A0D5D|nr:MULTISPECIES: CBS domain-containing protein [Poseidonibacter]MBU3014697.1 CBS domain-containing protein [Poseidonibacter lekithochrous]MDO6827995.1 CBS domain-containing protein [Poseidonibacter sp. 1_MG-2023]